MLLILGPHFDNHWHGEFVTYLLLLWQILPNADDLNSKYLLSYIVSVGPGNWKCLSWVVLSWSVSRGCSHLKAWLGLEDPPPTWLTHTTVAGGPNSSLAVGRRVQVLVTWISSYGCLQCPHVMAAGFPQSKWSKIQSKTKLRRLLWPTYTWLLWSH